MSKIILIDERYNTFEEINLNLSPISFSPDLATTTFETLLNNLVSDKSNHYMLFLVSENGKITRKVGVQDGTLCEWCV